MAILDARLTYSDLMTDSSLSNTVIHYNSSHIFHRAFSPIPGPHEILLRGRTQDICTFPLAPSDGCSISALVVIRFGTFFYFIFFFFFSSSSELSNVDGPLLGSARLKYSRYGTVR